MNGNIGKCRKNPASRKNFWRIKWKFNNPKNKKLENSRQASARIKYARRKRELAEVENSERKNIERDTRKAESQKKNKEIAKKFPKVNVKAICADLYQLESINKIINDNSQKIGFFPGSTIGNFSQNDAKKLLIGLDPMNH